MQENKTFKYYLFNKPYNVLSQFTKEIEQHVTLQDFLNLEKDVYPVGRLDRDSEGLLLLTNDNRLKHRVLSPEHHTSKTYWAQVEGQITHEALEELSMGVTIKHKKKSFNTQPCVAREIINPKVHDRDPPVRFRKTIPTSWLEIILTEGKNRQVRKMCAKVGFPVLRLLRVQIGRLKISELQPGEYKLIGNKEVELLLK